MKVANVEYDGKFTVSYLLDDGSASAFRVDPAMGRWIAGCWEVLPQLAKALNETTVVPNDS